MANMVTRCPKCKTSFRITEAQLRTAKGAVRCGSCLQIFKAMDNLVDTLSSPASASGAGAARQTPLPKASPAKPSQTRPSALPSTTSRFAAANPLAAQPKSGIAPLKQKPLAAAAEPSGERLHFDQAAIDGESAGTGDNFLLDDSDDLLISDDMDGLIDDTERTTSSKGVLGGTFSDSFLEVDTWRTSKKSLFDRDLEVTQTEEKDTADESWAVNLLEELEEEEAASARAQSEPSSELDKRNPTDAEEALDPDGDDDFAVFDDEEEEDSFAADPEEKREPHFGSDSDFDEFIDDEKGFRANDDFAENDFHPDGLRADRRDRAALLSGIEPPPVEMAWQQADRRYRRQKWLWSGLTIGVALVLAVQIAVFQFDRLSRLEPYRKWYGAVCPLLGCELADLVDPSRIRAYNLVVRSHPHVENALVVDTILLNTAPFPQPFPKLLLSFSNLNGELQSARIFTPREYLGGELIGRTHMPSGQPVHLSLEIVDPGREATNYSVAITL